MTPLKSKRNDFHTPVLSILLLALIAAMFAVACTASADIPTIEQRASALNKTIMCPVCPGESIDQSQNDLAIQMRGIVKQKLREGWTDEQIRQFWVDRYGPSVLLEPPRRGFSLLVWVLPPVGVLAAGAALYLGLRWMRRSPAPQSEDVVRDVELSDEEFSRYVQRVEAILDSGDETPPPRGGASSYRDEGVG